MKFRLARFRIPAIAGATALASLIVAGTGAFAPTGAQSEESTGKVIAFPARRVTPPGAAQAPIRPAYEESHFGKLYDGEKLIGKILGFNAYRGEVNYLGEEGLGGVYEAKVRFGEGNTQAIQTLAMKAFFDPTHRSEIQKRLASWELLKEVKPKDKFHVLAPVMGPLRLEPGPGQDFSPEPILLSASTDGSAHGRVLSRVALPYRASDSTPLLNIIQKYKNTTLDAIQLLQGAGLAHGDIKLENVLVQMDHDFSWNHPNPDKLRFVLSGFDGLRRFGTIGPETSIYRAPETLASKGSDLYSLALSVYRLVFDTHPVQDFLQFKKAAKAHSSNRVPPEMDHAQLSREIDKLFLKDKDYAKFLSFVNDRFELARASLRNSRDQESLKDIQRFVLAGLKPASEERYTAVMEANALRCVASQVRGATLHRLSSPANEGNF